MSIDSRFSKLRFRTEIESGGARCLSDDLQQEVLAMLQHGVCEKVQEIAELLNLQGHQLTSYYPPRLGDIAFRDDRCIDGNYECDLRLGVDIVVSVGYRDTKTGFEDFVNTTEESLDKNAEGDGGTAG